MTIEPHSLSHAGKVLHVVDYIKYEKNENEDAVYDAYEGVIDTSGLEFLCVHWVGGFSTDPVTNFGFLLRGANIPGTGFSGPIMTPFKVEGPCTVNPGGTVTSDASAFGGFVAFYKELPRYVHILPEIDANHDLDGQYYIHIFGWVV